MSRKRRLVATVWLDWNTDIAELFEDRNHPLFADLTAPKRVRVYPGLRHTTLVARFTGENGHSGRITLRIPRNPE